MQTFANVKSLSVSLHHSRNRTAVATVSDDHGDKRATSRFAFPGREVERGCVEGLCQIVQTRLAEGYDAYVLTFMFQSLSPAAGAAIMTRAIETAYSRILTRLVRYPNTAYNAARPLIWLGFPDYPVPKRRKQSLRDAVVNDGRHVHVVVLVPPFTRLKRPFDAFFDFKYALFLGDGVQRVQVEPLDRTVDHAVRYFAKSLSRGRIGVDDLIVLPRSLYELSAAQHPNNGRAGQVRRALAARVMPASDQVDRMGYRSPSCRLSRRREPEIGLCRCRRCYPLDAFRRSNFCSLECRLTASGRATTVRFRAG